MRLLWITLILLAGCDNDLKTQKVTKPTPSYKPEVSIPSKPRKLPLCQSYCKDWSPNNDLTYNTLAFANFGYRGIGRCRGHAILTQKLAQLLVFNQNSTCSSPSDQCQQELKTKLRNAINNYQVVDIEGYKNLLDLSDEDDIQPYLKAIVRGTSNWFSSKRAEIVVKEFDHPNKNIFYDIIRRVELKTRPYLGVVGVQKISSHALLAYDYRFHGSSEVICIEDSNIVADPYRGLDCENYLFYHEQENAIYYHIRKWNEKLAVVNIYQEDEERDQKYKMAWNQYCQKKFKGVECL